MLDTRRHGQLPQKPHTALRLYGELHYEHCVTRDGFDGPFSLLYLKQPAHYHGDSKQEPNLWLSPEDASDLSGTWAPGLRRRHFRTQDIKAEGTHLSARAPLLYNSDLTIGVVKPMTQDDRVFANADGDELFYIHKGEGVLTTPYGRLSFHAGEYLFIPKATPYHIRLQHDEQHWFWMESTSGFRLLNQYRNPVGQLRMDAPYTHRDFVEPELVPCEVPSEQRLIVYSKRGGTFSSHQMTADPFDVVGWDGSVYPFTFPILKFSPKIGQIHLPPTVHGTFATGRSLVCSFVPRNVDFHPDAIPCPYPHSNVDVDEVIFYCDGDFTSRRGVGAGSVSLHPAGVPHGPHPGAYERSIGTTRAEETAVMIDTFEPLKPCAWAQRLSVDDYDESWQKH